MTLMAAVLSHVLFAYLVVGEPVVGIYCYRALQRDVATDPSARSRFFRLIILVEWTWLAIVAIILMARRDPIAAIGLRGMATSPIVVGLVTGILAGLVASTAAFALNPRSRAWFRKQVAGVGALLPTTPGERWLFAGVAITAGLCEEIVFRGFLRLYLEGLGLPLTATGVVAALIFGVAHAYQGWRGMAQTAAMGGAFMALFVASGSLLPGMVAHALIDLRVLVIARGA